jgi:hypothetical protein
LLERSEVKALTRDTERIQKLYQLAFQRNPDEDEIKLATRFLQSQAASFVLPETPAWSYGYGHFDEATHRIETFTPLPHWTGYAWQGGTNLPDPKLGWVILNADGGHVGNDLNHAAIRRWCAPSDGIVSIQGELHHPSEKGDGVRGRIVSDRQGELGEWTAQHSQTMTKLDRVEVKRGDMIDFVTDCRSSVDFDSFYWAPVIKYAVTKATRDEPEVWDAKSDFSGPAKPKPSPLSPWQKYAQTLLLANELVFVD